MVHQVVLPPKGAVGISQYHVVFLLIDSQHDTLQVGFCLPKSGDQGLLPGEGFAVDQHAAQAFPRPVGADIEMTKKAGAGCFVVGGDVIG